MLLKALLTICLCIVLHSQGYAAVASFDCKKASTKIEKTICQDDFVAGLDRCLSGVYHVIKKNNGDSSILKSQKIWLKNRPENDEGV